MEEERRREDRMLARNEWKRERERPRTSPGRQCGTQSGIVAALTSRWCV